MNCAYAENYGKIITQNRVRPESLSGGSGENGTITRKWNGMAEEGRMA
jgi:hypothetical protein